jgi:hypothetical protein
MEAIGVSKKNIKELKPNQNELTEREKALFFVGLLIGLHKEGEDEVVSFCADYDISPEVAEKAHADIEEFTERQSWKQMVWAWA